MRVYLFLLGFLLITDHAFANEIVWKVKHPFRYYYNQSDLRLHQVALQELQSEPEGKEKARYAPISHLERKLNNPSWWTNNPILADLKDWRQAEGRSEEIDLRLGWGSLLTNSAPEDRGEINQTCWDEDLQNHSRCDGRELHGTTGTPVSVGRSPNIRRGQYIYPKFHRIVLEVTGDELAGETCSWSAEQELFLSSRDGFRSEQNTLIADCAREVEARVPFYADGDRPVGQDPNGVLVEVTIGDRPLKSTYVKVRDIVIFALGDSFSSGEGNPEIPAKLHPTRAIGKVKPLDADLSKAQGEGFYGAPRRSPAGADSAAIWTDRRCHRSVYSYQTRVALQLAISPDQNKNHHHAITYLQFSCSGAEVTEDLMYAWEGRECLGKAKGITIGNAFNHPYYMPQISKASRELCQFADSDPKTATLAELHKMSNFDPAGQSRKDFVLDGNDHYLDERRKLRSAAKNNRNASCGLQRSPYLSDDANLRYCDRSARARKIDLLLTTAGGNDIGFSKIIAGTIINKDHKLIALLNSFPLLEKMVENVLFVDKEEAQRRIDRLPHRLGLFNKAIVNFLGVHANGGSNPIITMAYPNLIYAKDFSNADEKDRFCKGGRELMDISEYLSLNEAKLADVEDIIENSCEAENKNCGLVAAIRKYGQSKKWRVVESHRDLFKAHGLCASNSSKSPNESGKGTAEIVGIPYKIVDLTKSTQAQQYGAPWQRFDPVTEHYPYESRQTGFRTPNQDYLNIQYFKHNMPQGWENKKEASAIFLTNRILGGSFHPTAQAHAHIADHIYCEAREELFQETCDPAKVSQYAHPWGSH